MKRNQRISFHQFTYSSLKSNPEVLAELSEFYCKIWMYDPNFKEYKVCPLCGKYFSFEESEAGVKFCFGSENEHLKTELQDAWNPDNVAADLLADMETYGNGFYGAYAYDNIDNKIVGFVWGWLESWEKIQEKWGEDIYNYLYDGNVEGALYFSELASDVNIRNQGIGSGLVYSLTYWMKDNYPELPTFLRTHRDSPARRLFERVGYSYFAEDPQHGDGRIMLETYCEHLYPEDLGV